MDFTQIIKPLRGPTCMLKTSKISTQVEIASWARAWPKCDSCTEKHKYLLLKAFLRVQPLTALYCCYWVSCCLGCFMMTFKGDFGFCLLPCLSHLGPTWEFPLCLKPCNLASYTIKGYIITGPLTQPSTKL